MSTMDTNSDNSFPTIQGDMPPPWMQDDIPPSANASTAATPSDTGDSGTRTPVTDTTSEDAIKTDELDAYIAVIIRDGLDQPIPGLTVKIELPEGQPIETKTDDHGAVTMPAGESKGEATLHVRDMTGQYQEVCKIEPAKCTTGAVVVRSSKVVTTTHLRPHHAKRPASSAAPAPSPAPAPAPTPPNTQPQSAPQNDHPGWFEKARQWLKDVMHPHDSLPATPLTGAQQQILAQAANKSGNPITIVAGPECPNKDNLCLGKNSSHRQTILDAAKRLKLCPQAICALIDCEADMETEMISLTGKDGKPLMDKHGKPRVKKLRERWKADSLNAQTDAAGLTQFTAGTWLTHVLVPGFYIQEQSTAKGWVRLEKAAKGKLHGVFLLADGKTTMEPWKHKSDANVKQCLAMRMDPAWSINAAADYGNANLKLLQDANFKLKGLNDMERAKLMYLMHHEGDTAGPLFIRNELAKGKGGIEALRKKFAQQFGKDGKKIAEKRIAAAGGDVEAAYRLWLGTYLNDKFEGSNKYFCFNPIKLSTISDILVTIGGEKIREIE